MDHARGNLNAARAARAKARAARRGETGETLPVVFGEGDPVIAEVGPELPLEVFAPLLSIDLDLPSLVVQVLEAASKDDKGEGAAEALVGVLVTNPDLPRDLIEAAKQIGRNLLGEDGFARFVAERPSPQDVQALIVDLMDWFGVDLGDFWRSALSSPAGPTPTPTSAATTPGLTSAASGGGPATTGSSESAA